MKREIKNMNAKSIERVLGRVARSSCGEQGIGKIHNEQEAFLMLAVGFVKLTKESSRGIYALTLKGFRFLEKLRWDKEIKRLAGGGTKLSENY